VNGKINLIDALAQFDEQWSTHVVGSLDDPTDEAHVPLIDPSGTVTTGD
jgi:hypothetical protein